MQGAWPGRLDIHPVMHFERHRVQHAAPQKPADLWLFRGSSQKKPFQIDLGRRSVHFGPPLPGPAQTLPLISGGESAFL